MLSTPDSAAPGENWNHLEIVHLLSGRDWVQVSLHELKERADRARASCYAEVCKGRSIIPESRALIRRAREISNTLQAECMRHVVLVVEVKRNFAIGGEIYEAALRTGQPRIKHHATSLQ